MWELSVCRRDGGGDNPQQDQRERKDEETCHFRRTCFMKVRHREDTCELE